MELVIKLWIQILKLITNGKLSVVNTSSGVCFTIRLNHIE